MSDDDDVLALVARGKAHAERLAQRMELKPEPVEIRKVPDKAPPEQFKPGSRFVPPLPPERRPRKRWAAR